MAHYGIETTIEFAAYDTDANDYKTGDKDQFTLRWVKDGISNVPTNACAEVDATNAKGIYKITLTAAEMQCQQAVLCGVSSTGNVIIIPTHVSPVRVPNAAPGGASGLALFGDEMDLIDDAITLSKFDESTAFPLVASDAGATQVARVGADSDTLETLSDQLDTAGTPPTAVAIRTEIDSNSTQLAAIVADTGELQTDNADGGRTDLLVDAIKAKTDTIPASPAVVGSQMNLADNAITAGKYDEETAYSIKHADTGATALARTGADSDTLEDLSDQLDSIVISGGLVGPGGDAITITLKESDGTPIADADVWITTDAAGANVIAGTLQTNSSGQTVKPFMLDAGVTYYRWAQKDGVNFTNPTSFVAAAD